jgi:L-ascorbate metabolism protein UlaG (beta-lactamase superfamily)
MKRILWLGQAGIFFEWENLRVMIDPYLSDSVAEMEPKNKRRVPVPDWVFDLSPDVLIFTHCHRDHYDPESIAPFLQKGKPLTVLSPSSVWKEVRQNGGDHNYVLFDQGTAWTEQGIKMRAVPACHSDEHAIGLILDDGEKKYYVAGDTLYNEKIFPYVPEDVFTLFLPINGRGNNMNMTDALSFCERVKPELAVPMHCGLFDQIDMNAFAFKNKVVPKFFEEVILK